MDGWMDEWMDGWMDEWMDGGQEGADLVIESRAWSNSPYSIISNKPCTALECIVVVVNEWYLNIIKHK